MTTPAKTTPAKHLRFFVGLPLSPNAQRSLREFCRRLREHAPEARWVAEESMHITLFFLGNTSAEQVPAVISSLKEIQSAPLDLTIDGIGSFERAGVFFAATRTNPELIRLALQVKQRMVRCGFPDKESEYRPHVTLARIRHGMRSLLTASRGGHPLHISFTMDRFLLYRSHLSQEGSHYEIVEEFLLKRP